MAQAVKGQERPLRVQELGRLAPAARRQPAELDREQHDHDEADPEGREREAEDRAGHQGLGAGGIRPDAGIEAERHADENRQQHGGDRQFQRCRHPLQDDRQRRLAEDEAAPQIAAQRTGQEREILLPQRPVEPEGGDDAQPLVLCRVGRQKHRDRVSDHVHADEDDDGHRKDDCRRLDHTLGKPADHGAFLSAAGSGEPAGDLHFAGCASIASVRSSRRASMLMPLRVTQALSRI